jgi:type 1 glutamine amidotransferase
MAAMTEQGSDRRDAYVVCGGDFHDFDFARLELLKLLAEHPRVRTAVASDYADLASIAAADFLITYTCNVRPTEAEQRALADFVAGGARWFALHGTNSVLDLGTSGVTAPRVLPTLVEVLGSQFVAHPPIAPYTVHVTDPDHPFTKGIEPFETDDELYLSELHGSHTRLLETRWTGRAKGFVEADWPNDDPRPVAYLRSWGRGEVLYLTLGHCRGQYDMQPHVAWYPVVERGSWEVPAFYELLRRGVRWALGEL